MDSKTEQWAFSCDSLFCDSLFCDCGVCVCACVRACVRARARVHCASECQLKSKPIGRYELVGSSSVKNLCCSNIRPMCHLHTTYCFYCICDVVIGMPWKALPTSHETFVNAEANVGYVLIMSVCCLQT